MSPSPWKARHPYRYRHEMVFRRRADRTDAFRQADHTQLDILIRNLDGPRLAPGSRSSSAELLSCCRQPGDIPSVEEGSPVLRPLYAQCRYAGYLTTVAPETRHATSLHHTAPNLHRTFTERQVRSWRTPHPGLRPRHRQGRAMPRRAADRPAPPSGQRRSEP